VSTIGSRRTPLEITYLGYSAPASMKATRYGKVTGSSEPVEIAHMSFSVRYSQERELGRTH